MKCVLLDRDGTVIRHIHYLNRVDQIELIPHAASAISRLNQEGYKVGLVTNQAVVAMGGCSLEELQKIHQKLSELLSQESAFLDQIFFCPHHPEGKIESFRRQCSCRKPGTGMVEEALKTFGASREKTWMIGDTTSDVQTAHNANIHSVLVETGIAGLDQKFSAKPEYRFQDLNTAVDFILRKSHDH